MNRFAKTICYGLAVAATALLLQSAAQAQGTGPVIPAKAAISALDQPLALMQEAKTNYTAVKDYSCTLVSQERVRGVLGDENIIDFKLKAEPFSVAMRWLAPKASVGQEVVYVKGKNNNKMRVKSTKLGGVFGFVSVDVNDPRVLQHSRHTVVEAGIGNMIDQCLVNWEVERKLGKTDVKDPVRATYNGRECIQIELVRPQKQAGLEFYRTVICLEKSSKLPVSLENYDWPRQGGPAGGELMESFRYANLRFNTGLKDADFNK